MLLTKSWGHLNLRTAALCLAVGFVATLGRFQCEIQKGGAISKSFHRMACAVLACLVLALPAIADAAARVTGMTLLSAVRVDRTNYEYTYSITVVNDGAGLGIAKATVHSSAPSTKIIKNTVEVGRLAANTTVTSTDTFTLRQDRNFAFSPASLKWTVTDDSVSGGSPTLEITISDQVVPPSGTVAIAPTLRDGSGNVISNTGYQFVVTVAPVGQVFGNVPVVAGLNVSFPKLAKKLLNQDTVIDPAGEYSSTDPSDSNYGFETGGTYRVTVTVPGLPMSASRDVLVLPTGTAAITLSTMAYAGNLADALALGAKAAQTQDAVLMNKARSSLAAVIADSNQSASVLEINVAAAPPDGYIVTPNLLTARGFVPGSQDAKFAAEIAKILVALRLARAQVETTNMSALSQAAVDALAMASESYRQASQALTGLAVSPLATSQQQSAINELIAVEIPRLLDAIKLKAAEALSVPVMAKLTDETTIAEEASETHFTPSPLTMYAATQPVQWGNFIFTSFSIFTDLSGTAKANILELSIVLANYITNLEIARIVNEGSSGDMGVDYCLASTSFGFVCPSHVPTRVGGHGFGRDPSKLSVAIIGCVNAELFRNLLRLKLPPNSLAKADDIAAAVRYAKKIYSLVKSLQRETGFAAVVHPDFISDDEFGISQDMLNFSSGWPRMNQGRVPCAGVVVVLNLTSGNLTAFNVQMLGECI